MYAAADRLLEGADWVVWQLTGEEKRNSCTAGYKAIWSKREGFPSGEFFKALDARMEQIVDEKMARTIYPLGAKAGGLSDEAARWTGLQPGTAVAIANVDAHVSVPAATVAEPGRMVIIMGTSNCHMVLATEERIVPGMCGYVEDGIIPGFFGYEGRAIMRRGSFCLVRGKLCAGRLRARGAGQKPQYPRFARRKSCPPQARRKWLGGP